MPNMFDKPGDALQQGLAMQERRRERQYEIDFRNQRLKEADDWRKLQLIQELSNVDKYQTGESVADALGNMKSAEILQKYTALAGSMSPAELQAKISQDIQNTATGMQSMKDELVQSNKVLADLKTRFPSLDTKALDSHYRKDVLNRRVENGEFKNPIHVNPTNMRLDDPDFLAAFVSGDKAIREEIVNPKLVEKGVQVGMGSPSSYTMMKGDIPFFRERNFDKDKDVVNGFLKKGINPQMKLKSKMEKIAGQDMEVLNEDAFEVFSENAKLEFNALAARKFPDFYNLPKAERDKLRRRIALEEIQQVDQSGFSFGTATKPPHYSSTTNVYGSGGAADINDLYGRISDRVEGYAKDGYYTRGNALKGDELAAVRQAAGDNQLDVADFFLAKNNDGIGVYKAVNKEMKPVEANLITTLPKRKTNLSVQADVGGKRKVVAQGEDTTPKGGTYQWQGYNYSEDEVRQGAAAEKLSVDAYLKKHGIKKN